jgi:hypothetical protein
MPSLKLEDTDSSSLQETNTLTKGDEARQDEHSSAQSYKSSVLSSKPAYETRFKRRDRAKSPEETPEHLRDLRDGKLRSIAGRTSDLVRECHFEWHFREWPMGGVLSKEYEEEHLNAITKQVKSMDDPLTSFEIIDCRYKKIL